MRVAITLLGNRIPRNGVLPDCEWCCAGSIAYTALGSMRQNVAGSPVRNAVVLSPAIRAGPKAISSATFAQSNAWAFWSTCVSTDSAVSRPVMPNGAAHHGWSLRAAVCGAWSVATEHGFPECSDVDVAP